MKKIIEQQIKDEFQKNIKGCGKRTGYFEGSPYYCGSLVITTPYSAFGSYCKKCLSNIKKTLSRKNKDAISIWNTKRRGK